MFGKQGRRKDQEGKKLVECYTSVLHMIYLMDNLLEAGFVCSGGTNL